MPHFQSATDAADWVLEVMLPAIDRRHGHVLLSAADGERLAEAEAILNQANPWWEVIAAEVETIAREG